MPEHDPNGAARRPVLKRVDMPVADGDSYQWIEQEAAAGRLWRFTGEFEAKGGETGGAAAADLARPQNGPGVYTVFDAGSWGRGYWRG